MTDIALILSSCKLLLYHFSDFPFPCLLCLPPSLQFDREKKQKGESPGGLEEVLVNLTHSEFSDEQLIRLCGLQWVDFVELTDMDRRGALFWLSAKNNSHSSQKHSSHDDLLAAVGPAAGQSSSVGEEDEVSETVSELKPREQQPPMTVAQKRACRLKRTQSERVPELIAGKRHTYLM